MTTYPIWIIQQKDPLRNENVNVQHGHDHENGPHGFLNESDCHLKINAMPSKITKCHRCLYNCIVVEFLGVGQAASNEQREEMRL